MYEMFDAVSVLGFSGAVCAYLLYERDKLLKRIAEEREGTLKDLLKEVNENTKAITELSVVIRERL